MHTDPIADLLTRIRNGSRSRLQRVNVPASKMKLRLTELLKREGFVNEFHQVGTNGEPGSSIEIQLRYDAKGEPVIGGIKRLSTPGLRCYYGWDQIPRVRNGLGIMILTTSKGILTDREARQQRIGGEAVCAVW